MFKPEKVLFFLAILFLSSPVCSSLFAEESMTITTYYPSPYGIYNELQSNKLAVGDTNNDGRLSAADQPPEDGQLQVKRSVIFTPQAGLPAVNTKKGEVVYDNATNNPYYYNGSSWSRFGAGGVSYTYYCFNRASEGTPVCPASVTIGTQGPCDSGFNVTRALGVWGYCGTGGYGYYLEYFLPPGGSCGCPDGTELCHNGYLGKAYVCSQ